MADKKIKVLIVEDSKSMQEILTNLLSTDPTVEIVGKAPDPYVARELIKKFNPDVLTLDIIMPRMDGITFLKNLMRLHPLPVVMISALTEKGSSIALEALSLGAIDYLPKPKPFELDIEGSYAKNLIRIVKSASLAHVTAKKEIKTSKKAFEPIYHSDFLRKTLIVMGASTGGVEAFEYILGQLPKTFPAIVITQHIRPEFSSAFVERLNRFSNLMVKEASDNEEITPGKVFIAPGNSHLIVNQLGDKWFCNLKEGEPVNGHKPSIDVLFQSAARMVNSKIISILLTGMGEDGAQGAKDIHDAGGLVIVQDKESSVVFGMPGAAIKLNAVDYILPLNEIPNRLTSMVSNLDI